MLHHHIISQIAEMNGKMLGKKPLYVAVAERKEDRKARLMVISLSVFSMHLFIVSTCLLAFQLGAWNLFIFNFLRLTTVRCQCLALGSYLFLLASQDLIQCTMDEGEWVYAHPVMDCRINSFLGMVPLKTLFLITITVKDKWGRMLVQGETTTCQRINRTRSLLLDTDRNLIFINFQYVLNLGSIFPF